MTQNPNENPYGQPPYGKPENTSGDKDSASSSYPSTPPTASPYSAAQTPPQASPYAAPPTYGSAYSAPQGYPAQGNSAPNGNMYSAPSGHYAPTGTSTGINGDNWKEPRNLSIIYGAGSLLMMFLSFFVGFTGIFSLVLSPLAIIEAKKAKRMGQNATAGLVLGWIGIALIILSILFILLFVVIFGAAMMGGFGG